ncbi:MAG: hypothetical protein NT106_10595 [Candidatus Sumerlaeota bacterium]|nr:hypothetical protein [Candidatus Sumerlaeota bacterium]
MNSRKYVFSHAALLFFIMTFFCSASFAGATGFDVSAPTLIEVKQAFPQKLLVEILLGRQTPTTQDRQTLDFNKDGILDVSDIITYIQSQK